MYKRQEEDSVLMGSGSGAAGLGLVFASASGNAAAANGGGSGSQQQQASLGPAVANNPMFELANNDRTVHADFHNNFGDLYDDNDLD